MFLSCVYHEPHFCIVSLGVLLLLFAVLETLYRLPNVVRVNKSNCNVYASIVKHNYVLDGMLFTIRKAQLHVAATNFGHHQFVQ